MSFVDKKFNHLKIPLVDIQTATNSFADENIIGIDGFGKIYKGQLILVSGELVDIAALRWDKKREHRTKEFQTEIMMLSSLKHQNLVTNVGFCDESDEKIVINKFEANRSLSRYLNDPVTLTWTRRLQICLGIARALSYIYYEEGRSFSVIHRNINSDNILVGENWKAKLSGFGLSTLQPVARRHGLVLEYSCGTFGYIDPAYLATETVTHKSDVYSFGVVLFEVLSGRSEYNTGNTKVSLAELGKTHYENRTLNDIIHPGLHNQMDTQSLEIFSEAAYCCLREQRAQSPSIDRVIFALEQALKFQLTVENSLVLIERNHWKARNLEHLKIGFDAIKLATDNFAEKYRIGSGGYGVVYKAELEHFDSSAVKDNKESDFPRRCSTVAIKSIFKREDKEGEQGFIVEVETLSSCTHPNVVSLLGFCYEPPHMILVYEHLSNGSLDDYLGSKGKMTFFPWVQRIKICIDIARGLDYIHSIMDDKQKIIHRDIKSANILLGEKWEAKIADFGLSKFHPLDQMASTINTKNVAGTHVYMDPEYEKTGKLKKESDVYSFGVVLFEILSGTLAYDPVYTNEDEKGLAPIVRQHFEKGTIKEMVDPNLTEQSNFTLSKGPNQDSLNTFSIIGYQCLAEKQVDRPTIRVVIEELSKALNLQETHKDSLRIPFEDIRLATKNFNNEIGDGGFGRVYKGEVFSANGTTPIAVKRHTIKERFGQGEKEFLTELEILFEYKHENIIGLIGYCNENNEKILVYEYASNGSLDKHLKDASLTWTKRLRIAIDVAKVVLFLHGGENPVIHRDIKSANILLTNDWKAKVTDFGLSMITPISNKFEFVVESACGTRSYVDPHYTLSGFLTRESDIYSLGVVLFEIMCGTLAYLRQDENLYLVSMVRRYYLQGKVDELVLEGMKNKIVSKSLTTYQRIAYECINIKRDRRPTASEVVLQLKKALRFQEDIEIWEAKLPRDYKEMIKMSEYAETYSTISNKELCEMFSKGILLYKGKVCLSVNANGDRSEMVSATMFLYEIIKLMHKRMSIQNSRFKRVMKIMDISNLNIQIKIKTHFLSPNVIYGAHLIFKFCNPRKTSSKLMYVNLKYQMGSETRQAYFATCEDDDWMMIELCRLIPHKKDVQFEVLLESLSRYYCGNNAIYIEGIHFRAINDATLKVSEVDEKLTRTERLLKSNSDSVQQVPVDYEEITQSEDGGKLFSSEANENKCHKLPAKMVLYENAGVKCFNWIPLADSSQSRFQEVAEVLSQQVFRIKCKIETEKLSPDTNYACYLVFKLSQQCHGLYCPVKVQDVLLRKNKELKFLYFRSPKLVNLHNNGKIPKLRDDGLMEVILWEFNSGNKLSGDYLPMSLKLRCYEGNMSGLTVYGIEFRPT